MSSAHPEPLVFGLITVLASLIVGVGWFVAAGLAWTFVHRKIKSLRALHGELPAPESTALLLYALAVFFWPAGFGLGAYFLGRPETALQGRTCLAIGLGNISVIVVLTCIGFSVAGFMLPELFMGLY